jgi:hypothetical protein
MNDEEELTLANIATERGLSSSAPRYWVRTGKLPAHRDSADPRRWLVYRHDLDAFLDSDPSIGHPKLRGLATPTSREDWSDAPEQATFDLVSSVELPGGRR